MRITLIILFFWALQGMGQGYRDSVIIGANKYYVYVVLPDSYAANPTKYYPGIMFAPGSGESKNDWSRINIYGFNAMRIDSAWDGVVTIGDSTYEFISYAWQQPTTGVSGASVVVSIKDTMASRLRIDTCRYYATALSQGGQQTFRSLATTVSTDWGKKLFATAAVIFSSGKNLISNAAMSVFGNWTAVGGSIKYTYGASDSVSSRMLIDTVVINGNSGRAGSATGYQWTMAQGWPTQGHGGWNYGFGPSFRWEDADTLSVWSWLLGHSKKPWAQVEEDTITISTDYTTLTGITKQYNWGYNGWNLTKVWTQISGTPATITSPTSDVTGVTDIVDNSVFRITCTSSGGLVATADVVVNVESAATWPISKKEYQKIRLVNKN